MTSPAMKALRRNLQRKLEISRRQGEMARQKLPDGKQHSPNVPGRKTDLAPEREGHSGRKGDILEQFHNKTGIYEGRKNNARPPVILKITIAGSGCEVWMTHADETGKKSDDALTKMDLPDLDSWWSGSAPATYANKKGDITFSGPMALGGLSDIGKNSIRQLVMHVPGVIKRSIPKEYKSGADVVLLIKAHSRGAVAASQIAEVLKKDLPKMRVELTQFDPVPGPASAYGKNADIAVGDHTRPVRELQPDMTVETVGEEDVEADVNLDESTLIYSMGAENGSLFKPQRVHGAKRIIISAQVHGGGTRKGYKINGELFKGSRLNSMPPGAYYEKDLERGGAKGEKYSEFKHIGILEKMTKEDFYKKLQITYDKREGMGDWGRFDVVRDALEEFFLRNG